MPRLCQAVVILGIEKPRLYRLIGKCAACGVKIDFAQLWQTTGYADIAEAERVSLCDTVHVYISKLGIEVSCKVTETEYDVLLERYKSITLSNATVYSRNSSLSGSLGSLRDEAQLATEAINRVETQVTDVRTLTVQ